jgi:hemolysin III
LNKFIKIPEERFSTYSHLVGAILSSITTIIYLIVADGIRISRGEILLFGFCHILLFTASTITHSQKESEDFYSNWSIFDQTAIFVLIAGSYTSIVSIFLGGAWKIGIITAQWIFAALGTILKIIKVDTAHWITGLIYLIQGWMIVLIWSELRGNLHPEDLLLIIVGAICYTGGAIIYMTRKPKLWPGKFGSHDLFHILVLIGAAAFFVMVGRAL